MGTVLIVDDDRNILSVLGLIIEQEEHTAFEAAGGVKALKVLEAHHVDLAFIDLGMPEMDGIELMKRVRELYPNVKLAPMSAFADLQGVPSEYAAVAFLVKPFAVEDVQAVLAQAFEQSQTGASLCEPARRRGGWTAYVHIETNGNSLDPDEGARCTYGRDTAA